MSPNRQILGLISGNRRRNSELTPCLRGAILTSKLDKLSVPQIATRFDLPVNTVKTTIKRATQRPPNGVSKKREGRPKLLSQRDIRRLVREVRLHPLKSYRQIKHEFGWTCHNTTILNYLKPYHIARWRAARRPILTEEHAQLRLQWCLLRCNWTIEQWRKHCFSDECSVERGRGKRPLWCWRTSGQRLDTNKVDTYTKGKALSIMVWGAIIHSKRSDLVACQYDEDSQNGGVTARSYCATLEEGLLTFLDPSTEVFQQDNARIHTAKYTLEWLEEWGIQLIDWPSCSPDLNPIENVWALLKDRLYEMYPELIDMDSKSQDAMDYLFECLVNAWDSIPQEHIDNCIDSMKDRVQAVIDADGWHTKY